MASSFYDIVGKFVALTGNNTVGYGATGNRVLGKVISIQEAGNTSVYSLGFGGQVNSATFMLDAATTTAIGGASGTSYTVGVEWGKTSDYVASVSGVVAGDLLDVNGSGSLAKAAGTNANVVCLGVNATNGTMAIRIM